MSIRTNVTININQANAVVKVAGESPLQPNASDKDLEKALKAALTANFTTVHPGQTLPAGNVDFGYMGPFSAVQQGQVPQCVVTQITQDFKNWQIGASAGAQKAIAQTITTDLVSHGGQAGASSGTTSDGPNMEIYWLTYAGEANANGDIVYVFGAVEGVDIG